MKWQVKSVCNFPKSFNFSHPDLWGRWIKHYRAASGLLDKDESMQLNTHIYAMGEEAEDVLASSRLNKEDRKKYNTIKASFEHHLGRGITRYMNGHALISANSSVGNQWILTAYPCRTL